MRSLVFVGTGEALDPELPNTSLLVDGDSTRLLMDCGYAVPHAFWKLSRDPDLLDGVWISHAHADHCFGLPALLLWMRLAGRQRGLRVLGGPGSAKSLRRLLDLGYPGSFAPHKCYPIEFQELVPGEVGQLGELELRVAPSRHSIVNHALRVDAAEMCSVVYSGDGVPTSAIHELCRGASILVHECFFLDAPEQHKHGDFERCLVLARDAGVDTLALLHFAAEQREALGSRVSEYKEAGLEVIAPMPGSRLSLELERTTS